MNPAWVTTDPTPFHVLLSAGTVGNRDASRKGECMITMKVSEYRPLLIEAIRKSKEERWIPLSKNISAIVPDCPLCTLACMFDTNRRDFFAVHNLVCPLYNDNTIYDISWDGCSDSWHEWTKAANIEEYKRAALKVIEELDAINVDDWIEILIKRGALERG